MKTIVLRESQAPYTLPVDDETLTREPVFLERGGKPVAVIIPIAEYEALQSQRQESKWEDVQVSGTLARDRAAFLAMKKQLLKTHSGQYVAFKDAQFEDADPDDRVLIKRLYARFGVVPLYIKRVEAQEQVYHLPGPRIAN